jgi:hypothetical protein
MTSPPLSLGELFPGDLLFYGPHDLFGWITSIKTWCREAVHVETYIGEGLAAASRNGQGVSTYDIRMKGLTYVRRPVVGFTLSTALRWHNACCGQKAPAIVCFVVSTLLALHVMVVFTLLPTITTLIW